MVFVALLIVFLLFSWLGMIINGGTFYTALGCGAVTICASVIIIKKLDTIIEMMKENNNAGFYRHYSKTKSDKDDENDDK